MATDIQAMLSGLLSGASEKLDPAQLKTALTPLLDVANQTGGLPGMLEKLQANGMSEQVNSWLGQGANLAASPDQIMAALGPDKIKAAAEQAGTSATELAGQLSAMLPTLVDKLSPAGQLPGASNLTDLLSKVPGSEQVTGLLSGLLGGGGSSTPSA